MIQKNFRRGEKDQRRGGRERHPRPSPPPQSPHPRAHPQPQKGASSASQQSATELVVPPKKPRLAREPPPDPTTSLPKPRSPPNSPPSYPAPPSHPLACLAPQLASPRRPHRPLSRPPGPSSS